MFDKASSQKGITGENLLQIIAKARLDNIVYRMGISPTRECCKTIV
jgi:ribosomal protein S4